MTRTDHDSYARELLLCLSNDYQEDEGLTLQPDHAQSRNAARAMTAILCHRLSKKSGQEPTRKANTTYEWKQGAFNCRNIADRDYLWTNMRRNVADAIHESAKQKPMAYLLAFATPSDTTLSVWAIPEPILYDSLGRLRLEEAGQKYTLQIFPDKQRIEHDELSTDLLPYFRQLPLSGKELLVLKQSREVDESAKRERAIARGEEQADIDEDDDDSGVESETQVRYWAISLGEGGRLWDQCRNEDLAAIGWDYLGDLRTYASVDDFAQAIQQHEGGSTQRRNDARACYQFCREMRRGDVLFVKQGRSRLLGRGEIKSDYDYRPKRPEYHNVRKVLWTNQGNWMIPDNARLPVKTLTEVTANRQFLDFALATFGQHATTPPKPAKRPDYTIDQALEGVFIEPDEFRSFLGSISRKKNAILQGPPGVGKTYIARRLAYLLIGHKAPEQVGMVQFHQSYAYEDFIQGWRPTAEGGFKLSNGVFYEFCRKATADPDPDSKYVFIIDEINRGNLSKIFGELFLLIESDKRGAKFAIPLTYTQRGEDPFFVPENLYLLGLMNTADRSLAMVDYALRRRFTFLDLRPAYEKSEFRSFLEQSVETGLVDDIVSRMKELNALIRADKTHLGPGFEIGHSFFCPQDTDDRLDVDWYRSVIRTEIAPLVREYWFDDADKAESNIKKLLE